MRFFSVFCSRGDVPKAMFRVFFLLTSSFCLLFVPRGGGRFIFSLSLSYLNAFIERERERERESESETTSFSSSSERALFLHQSPLCFSANSPPKLTSGFTPYGFILPLKFISLSLFSFSFLLTHSFSLSFIKNNNNNNNNNNN